MGREKIIHATKKNFWWDGAYLSLLILFVITALHEKSSDTLMSLDPGTRSKEVTMRTFYEAVTFILFVTICLGVHFTTGFLQSLQFRVPAQPKWVTQKASAQEYIKDWSKVEQYGQFQMVLAPDRSSVDSGHSESEFSEFTEGLPSLMEWENEHQLRFMLDSHLYYEGGDIYAGIIRVSNKHESWQMSFLNIGAEGVLFSDHEPPEWVKPVFKSVDKSLATDQLQKELTTLRQFPANESLNRSSGAEKESIEKSSIAESIVGQMIYLMHDEFNSTNRLEESRP